MLSGSNAKSLYDYTGKRKSGVELITSTNSNDEIKSALERLKRYDPKKKSYQENW